MNWSQYDVDALRELLGLGLNYRAVANMFNVSYSSVKTKSLREQIIYNPELLKTFFCKKCNSKFIRNASSNAIFCSHHCSAMFNNVMRGRGNVCINCGKKTNTKRNKTCSASCSANIRYQRCVKDWLSGKNPGHTGKTFQPCEFVRRWLRENRGTACSICGWDERHPVDNKVLTELDHIDGQADNNSPENLRILCPNCHAMTPNFRARNKKSKRNRKQDKN